MTGCKNNILITGRPRVGKSTLVLRIVESLKEQGLSLGGFYTLEVREGNRRIGFDIHTLDGRVGRLARVGFESRHRLGKYGVDMEQFEGIALLALEDAIEDKDVIIIDEIGYMELKSRRFREAVLKALDSNRPVLATVMRNRFDFPDKIKARDDVELMVVRVDNRERLLGEILGMLKPLAISGSL